MPSFAELLAEKRPQIPTHQALLILDMQNEFISSDGGLPVSIESGFVDRIKEIVPKFRDLAGDVIWVRSEFKEVRIVNDGTDENEMVMTDSEEQSGDITALPIPETADDVGKPKKSKRKSGKNRKKAMALLKRVSSRKNLAQDATEAEPTIDSELFLSTTSKSGRLCQAGSTGAEFPNHIKELIDDKQDIVVVKSHYSAFKETTLLVQLRMKVITELFICGCMTNLSIYATALDAARHGFAINIVNDCLGYRIERRHDRALKSMIEVMGAYTITSKAILDDLNAPPDDENRQSAATGLEDKLGNMKLSESSKPSAPSPDQDFVGEITNALAASAITADVSDGKPSLEISKKSRPESTTVEPIRPVRRGIRTAASQPSLKQTYQKSKVRMRVRDDKSKSTTDRPASSSSNKEVSEAIPPTIPPLPNGSAVTTSTPKIIPRGESSRTIEKVVESPAKPPPESPATPAVAATAAPAKGNKDTNEEARLSTSKPRGNSIQKTLTSMKSSPSLRTTSRSTWPSGGVIAAFRRNSKQSAEEKDGKSKDEKGKEVKEKGAKEKGVKGKDAKVKDRKEPETAPQPVAQKTATMSRTKLRNLSNLPTRGPGDDIGEGDSFIKYNFLPDTLRDPINDAIALHSNIFHALYHEVRWQKMYHAGGEVPRLVAIQGTVDPKDGSKPIYRHPSDQSPPLLAWTHNINVVRIEAEKVAGHELNHCLIQLYRNGEDNISEHSDKTLDIVRGSSIVNVSFGAQRTMRLRTKKGYNPLGNSIPSNEAEKASTDIGSAKPEEDTQRITQRIPMPHNSIFIFGLESNARWLHGINADKRRAEERSEAEKAYNGMRISLTFRHIGTFLSKDETEIWGQGARGKDKDVAGMVVSGDEKETERMIRAFGKENHEWEVDWNELYGEGFDVLHFMT